MTKDGVIIVNNLLSSCHNVVKNNVLISTLLDVLLSAEQFLRRMLGLDTRVDETVVDLPPLLSLFLETVHKFIPEPYYSFII